MSQKPITLMITSNNVQIGPGCESEGTEAEKKRKKTKIFSGTKNGCEGPQLPLSWADLNVRGDQWCSLL